MFGDALDTSPVRIRRRKFYPLHPRNVTMAPRGHLHFHPLGDAYCDDFAAAPLHRQGLFIHELVHVWQTQTLGEWYLVLHRHPFCRYDYAIKPGWRLEKYGIEQQAEIVRHAFILREGGAVPGAPENDIYRQILPFNFK